MAQHESTFVVIVQSDEVGAALAERVHHQHRVAVLRALHLLVGGSARVFDGLLELTYDPLGNDMGHHPGHDEPYTMSTVARRCCPGCGRVQ